MPTTEQLNTALAGRYAVDHLVGEGGMATVYLARDVRHNRKVALKVLKPDLGAIVGVERFLSEIQVTANLQHPNLLPLFDSGEANGLLFYVMPYVEGESLRARLEREKQLPVDEAVRIATAIASALDYAHRHGVIHRDLKPENILIHDGQPVVADFGIALAVSNAGGNRITQTGLSLGTPQYMSPEQATGDRVIDARSDIYSLGAVTYEMLTGEPPHVGTTSQAIIARVLTEKPRTIRSSRPSVPPHVEAAIDHALEKLAPDRFATAKEFGEALTGARPFTIPTTSAVPSADASANAAHRSRSSRVREIALGVVALVGIASTAYLATRPAPPPPVPGRFVIELPESVTVSATSAQSVAIAPDGTHLAILGEVQGTRMIFLRKLDDPVATPVRGTEQALYHSFSPDGRWLLFRAASGALRTVSVDGGVAQTVADSVGPLAASWGPRNEILYSVGSGLWLTTSNGGAPRLVAKPDTANGIYAFTYPHVLPGGTHALASIQTTINTDSRRIAVVSLRDGKATIFAELAGRAPAYVASGHIVFARDGGFVSAVPFSLSRREITGPQITLIEGIRQAGTGASALAVARNGTIAYESGFAGALQGMFAVNREGIERPLKGPMRAFREPRVSPDGRRIVVRIGDGELDGGLWIHDIAAGTTNRLTADSGSIRAEWTRDGAQVIYTDHASTDAQLLVVRPWDLSGPPVILARGGSRAFQQVSIGLSRGYSIIRKGNVPAGDLLIAPTDSLAVARPFLATGAHETTPRVSPNGRLLAYASNKTGRNEIYLTTIPGPGPHVPVSVSGGSEPAWSSDAVLHYRSPTRMMAATVTDRPTLDVVRRDSLFTDIYRRYAQHTAYDVFPGGREFLMTRGPETRSTLFVIVNWQQLSRVRGGTAGER